MSSVSSLRPLIFPAELALTSLTYTSAPFGTITRSSTTIGASSDALKTCPVVFTLESTPSIMRTVIVDPAGTVTVLGLGGGGGVGAAGFSCGALTALAAAASEGAGATVSGAVDG